MTAGSALTPAAPPSPVAISDDAEELARRSLAPGTLKMYRGLLRRFDAWLAEQGRTADDASVADYLAHLHREGRAPGTIGLVPAALKWLARHSDRPSPVGPITARVLAGIRREGRERGRGQVAGLRWEDVQLVCAVALQGEPGPADLRDVALLMLMRDGLLRIGEAIAIQVEDIEGEPDGSGRLTVRRSKTDQEGRGSVLYLGASTMDAVRSWQRSGAVDSGPLIRRVRAGGHVQASGISAVAARAIIRARARAAGIMGRVSGHSCRVGSAQSLAAAGCGLVELQDAGRWKSPTMAGHYARSELAGRGAIARLLHGA